MKEPHRSSAALCCGMGNSAEWKLYLLAQCDNCWAIADISACAGALCGWEGARCTGTWGCCRKPAYPAHTASQPHWGCHRKRILGGRGFHWGKLTVDCLVPGKLTKTSQQRPGNKILGMWDIRVTTRSCVCTKDRLSLGGGRAFTEVGET